MSHIHPSVFPINVVGVTRTLPSKLRAEVYPEQVASSYQGKLQDLFSSSDNARAEAHNER